MRKNKGFTLIEMLIVVAILGIFMTLSFNVLQTQTIDGNKNFNNEINLQTGVRTSLDKIKGILKGSTQIHLVGKEVYEPGMPLTELDENFSYIGKVKLSDGSITLANILPNGTADKFDVIPILAANRSDVQGRFVYDFSLYSKDKDFNKKLDKKIMQITVNGTYVNNSTNKEEKYFELTEDISVSNANQILLSKFLSGSMDDVTAIAYDNKPVKLKTSPNTKLAVVLVFDSSGSMTRTMNNMKITESKHAINANKVFYFELDPRKSVRNEQMKNMDEYKIRTYYSIGLGTTYWLSNTGRDYVEFNKSRETDKLLQNDKLAPRNYLVGKVIEDTLRPALSNLSQNNVDISVYAFGFDNYTTYRNLATSGSHIFPISNLENAGYGPYRFEGGGEVSGSDIVSRIKTTLGMSFKGETTFSGATNTGMALLQGLDLLNQIRDVDNKFLILLSDGNPQGKLIYSGSRDFVLNVNKNNANTFFDYTIPDSMEYVKAVTDTSNGHNKANTFTKAYLIGFSGIQEDKDKLGLLNKIETTDPLTGRKIMVEEGTVPSNSIRAYLARSKPLATRYDDVRAYDAFDSLALSQAFNEIVSNISMSVEAFDGPKKRGTH